MKKVINILIAVCFCSVAFAQVKSEVKIDTTAKFRNELFRSGMVLFGIKAGYTHSNLYGSEVDYIFADSKTTALPSFHMGVAVNSQIGKYFWLKHELLLNQRGAGVSLNDSINGNYNSTIKMLHVDLYPVSPTFHFKGLQIYAGPYISLLADANIRRKDDNGNFYTDKSIFGDPGNREGDDEEKYLQKFDFGLNAGIEYQFKFGLFVGAKYLHGFTDIFQYANSYTYNDAKVDNIKIYNKAFMISVGYSFVKKTKSKTD